MSSWANRSLPRRRNLDQIPEAFRPTVLPRALQPEVLASESYQPKPTPPDNLSTSAAANPVIGSDWMNDFLFSSSVPSRTSTSSTAVSSSTSVSSATTGLSAKGPKMGATVQPVHPNAVELPDVVFVLLRSIQSVRDNDLWITSYNSIRRWYSNKIVIIDDHSMVNTVNGRVMNTEVIYSDYMGAGEILPYYYFLQNKWADRMIFLHDSMFLYRPFTAEELDTPKGVIFHWFFDANGHDNDAKLFTYLGVLTQTENTEDMMAFMKDPASVWKGCFGGATIIDLSVVEFLERKYHLFSKLVMMIRTRKDREVFERLLGRILFFEQLVDVDNCSNFGDILQYPNAFQEQDRVQLDTLAHEVAFRGYPTAILKMWKGR